jgi:predicted dehydrogenase
VTKSLVVGLGSMGQRRIRNLRALGHSAIAGFDTRLDRRSRAAESGVSVYPTFEEALDAFQPDVLVISTSPAHHLHYAWQALEREMPCFIEASVVDAEGVLALHQRAAEARVLMAPSCTMRYFEGPKKIKQLLNDGAIGQPLNVNYQTGQYLPDWHPWEPIDDYYVSRRETGGCREIVPFELTWLNDLFGAPEPRACVKDKLTALNADIDDVYHCLLRYPNRVLLNMTVEVLSQPRATRELRILGSAGILVFSSEEHCVRVANTADPSWTRFELGAGTVERGYINPEEPYIAEMRDFLDAARAGAAGRFPNTLLDDYSVLCTLCRLEELSGKAS